MSFDIHFIDATRSKSVTDVQRIIADILPRHSARLVEGEPIKHAGQTIAVTWIELGDGSRMDWYGPDERKQDTGAMVSLGSGDFSAICRLLYDFAAGTHWVISPGPVFLRAVESKDVPIAYPDFPETVIIQDARELELALTSSFGNWMAYRNKVIQTPHP